MCGREGKGGRDVDSRNSGGGGEGKVNRRRSERERREGGKERLRERIGKEGIKIL